jgi:low temperature requirement protein LtrA
MLGVAAVAISIHDALEGHHRSLAFSFAFIEIMITYLWWSVGFWDPSHRKYSVFYTTNYLIAFALLIVSAFVENKYVMPIWIVVLLLNLTPGLTGARTIIRGLKEQGQVFSASESIVERFGLFTIIVLAESVLSTVGGVAEIKDKQLIAWIAFILGILISFLLWSIYFDMTSEQETKTGYSYLQWLLFLHFPLLFALATVGACIRVLLEDMTAAAHQTVQWIFCISIATILLTIVGLTRVMKEEEEDRSYIRPVSRLLILISAIIVCIPFVGNSLNTVQFLSIISICLFFPVLIGSISWVRFRFKE